MNTGKHFNVMRMLAASLVLALTSNCWAQFDKPSPKNEADLIAVLRSDKPESDKAIACKYLSIYGSEAAVPELAKLLANEHLASWARTALEAIPGPVSDEALRKASESLSGNLLVGLIN